MQVLFTQVMVHAVNTTFQRCEIALNRIRRNADAILIVDIFFCPVIDLIVFVRHQCAHTRSRFASAAKIVVAFLLTIRRLRFNMSSSPQPPNPPGPKILFAPPRRLDYETCIPASILAVVGGMRGRAGRKNVQSAIGHDTTDCCTTKRSAEHASRDPADE
jgi:hypothetical protein